MSRAVRCVCVWGGGGRLDVLLLISGRLSATFCFVLSM